MTVLEGGKDPTISALARITEPFVIDFMYDNKYSEENAFTAYVEETKRRGFDHCSKDQFRRGFSLS